MTVQKFRCVNSDCSLFKKVTTHCYLPGIGRKAQCRRCWTDCEAYTPSQKGFKPLFRCHDFACKAYRKVVAVPVLGVEANGAARWNSLQTCAVCKRTMSFVKFGRMPNRIDKAAVPIDQQFHDVRKASEGDTNNCTVVAATIVTGKPFAEINEQFRAAGRVNGKGFSLWKTVDIIKANGKTMRAVDLKAEFIDKYPGAHNQLRSVTTHHMDRFNKVWKDGKTYFLNCNSHVVAVKDGKVIDWTRGKAMRVVSAWEVI